LPPKPTRPPSQRQLKPGCAHDFYSDPLIFDDRAAIGAVKQVPGDPLHFGPRATGEARRVPAGSSSDYVSPLLFSEKHTATVGIPERGFDESGSSHPDLLRLLALLDLPVLIKHLPLGFGLTGCRRTDHPQILF
jgi:hypothetical protein